MKKITFTLLAAILSVTAFASGHVAAITSTPATCYNSCNGTAVGSVTGGVGPFGYSWAGPSTYTAAGTNLTSLCPGTYTLTVTDSADMSTATANATIGQPGPITPAMPASMSVCSGSCIAVSGTVTGGAPPYTYNWAPASYLNFPTVQNPTICPTSAVTYTLTVTDQNGCIGNSVTSVTVNPLDDASFNYSSNVYCNSGANPIPTITGQIGGVFSVSPMGMAIDYITGEINLAVSTPGTYTVTYTTSGMCQNSSTFNLSIIAQQIATFSYTSNPYCANGLDALPTFSGGGIAGTFSATAGLAINPITGIVAVSASALGTYTVTNTIMASGGCPAVTASNIITISTGPDSTFIYGPTALCGLTTASYTCTPIANVMFYNWTLPTSMTMLSGAGTNSIVVAIAPPLGLGYITVNANNTCGTGPTTSLAVMGGGPSTGSITVIPDSTSALSVWTYNPTSAPGLTYAWDFGDGNVSSLLNPTHTYGAAGTYTVCLTSSIGLCSGTSCDTINVSGTLNSCLALFNIAQDSASSNPNAYTITNLSYGSNLTYLWDFGDTTTSTLAHPTHSYLGGGPYQLCLTVNNGAGCTQTYCDSLFAVDSLHSHLQPIALTVVGYPGQTTVGINQNSVDNADWIISPNPSNGNFMVSSTTHKLASIKVFNMLGEIVSNTSSSVIRLGVAPGIYFVQLIDENKNTVNRKIIIE